MMALNRTRSKTDLAVDESDAIAEISQAMSDKTVIIADGHHRYEVALAFATRRLRKYEKRKG
jgi:uncharacterized protein (DUF1015 family)